MKMDEEDSGMDVFCRLWDLWNQEKTSETGQGRRKDR